MGPMFILDGCRKFLSHQDSIRIIPPPYTHKPSDTVRRVFSRHSTRFMGFTRLWRHANLNSGSQIFNISSRHKIMAFVSTRTKTWTSPNWHKTYIQTHTHTHTYVYVCVCRTAINRPLIRMNRTGRGRCVDL